MPRLKLQIKNRKSKIKNQKSSPLPPTRYLFFGGKGGVGKTTAAAAAALLLLDAAAPAEQVLLFSTDPAHSLSDSFGLPIGDSLTEVAKRGRGARAATLFAREMDAARALEEFKTRHRAVLAEIAERGTLLDETDINELLDLSLPGMDEVMSLFELSEIESATRFARVVVDTAPSGHASRLLRLPEVFAHWIQALDLMSEKHRYMVAQFARGRRVRADEVDVFLRELEARVRRLRAMLFEGEQASFTLVTIPEAMSVEESLRYFELLRAQHVSVTDIIINRVEREHAGCPFCRARVRNQAPHLSAIESAFAELRVRRVPLFAAEVCGPGALRRFAGAAWAASVDESEAEEASLSSASGAKASVSKRQRAAQASVAGRTGVVRAGSSFALEPRRRLLIFGGKGGVGKTTAAVSVALALAARDEAARFLVFSTDPAHSLSDSFGESVGEFKRGVGGRANLDAMEIDPAARFEALKARYRAWAEELFESLTAGSRWEIQFDREAMREMVALAPPGIDEIAALSAISDLVENDEYAGIVLDTAPTGHLLRFLELPGVALSWVRTFIKLLLKYKNVVRWGGVAEELVALSKNIKRVAAMLTDAESCEFVGVGIPEVMSLEETERLAASLDALKVPMRRLLINNLVAEEAASACGFCAARRRAQARVIENFRRSFAPRVELFTAPQQPEEVRGPARLAAHFAQWRGLPRRTLKSL